MHIGILGTGFGRYHGELYKKIDPTIKLTYWGRNTEKLNAIKNTFSCECTTDLDAFLDNETFDFIDICLPSDLHADYALRALRKNHSVFIETPVVTSLEDGMKIKECAKETGKMALVNMFLFYDPYYRMIHDLKVHHTYGALKHLTVFRRTPPLWGKLGSENIALDLMIHDLCFANWLGDDLKITASSITKNADNSAATVDCLLSGDSLNVQLQGSSMLPLGAPFWVGYEATFENGFVSYFEKSFETTVETKCTIYSEGKEKSIHFELNEHCVDILRQAIKIFKHEAENDIAIDNALSALSMAIDLTSG